MLKLIIKNSMLVVFFILSVCSFSFAEETAGKDQTPIQIEADNMKYFGEKKMSLFVGSVVVTKGEMTMKSDEMEVFFTDDKEVKEILSRGNVKIEKEGLLALSGKAHIYQLEGRIVLTENARVWQGENYLEGDKVTLFNDSEKLYVDKGEDKRVKIIITPQKEN